MRSDFITYIDIGNGWTQFFPDDLESFKISVDDGQYFSRRAWGKLSISNDPDLYAVASNDMYRLYDILTGNAIPSFGTEELDFTFEIKVWFHTDDDDIYGYFGINDCEPDDDRKIIIVTPTIQDKYTSLLENWETPISFDDIEYDGVEVDLNVDRIGTVTINDWVLGTFAGTETIARVLMGYLNEFQSSDYLNGTINSFFDFSTQAPNRDVFQTPPSIIRGVRNGFTLADREEILGEDFSANVPDDWLSFEEYGVFDTTQLTHDVVTYLGKTYKSIRSGNTNNLPTNTIWWEEIYIGEIYPEKGDYELSEITVYQGEIGAAYNNDIWIYATTKFSRDEFRKVDVVSETDVSGFEPPTGSGWHMRSKISVDGQDGHLWTRKPFNGAFATKWALQDMELNPSGGGDVIYWTKKRTSKLEYINSDYSKTINTSIDPQTFFDYVLQNTNSEFASNTVKSTFFFNDGEADLPILADRIGEGINYVTLENNYLNSLRFFFTRDLIPDLDPSDTSTFPDVTLKKMIEDLNKLFNNNLYWDIDDNGDLWIEHIKKIELTYSPIDLRYESDGSDKPELSFTESWKYDKSKMFNRIELRQLNASGIDFTNDIVLFDKIVSNKRNVDIKLELETEMFSTDLRHAVENSSELDNGVMIICTELRNTLVVTPQIYDIVMSATDFSSGYAVITAGGVSENFEINGVTLTTAIKDFVTAFAESYLSAGITLTKGDGKLRFTKSGSLATPTIVNMLGDVTGAIVNVQAYSTTGSDTLTYVRNLIGFFSRVELSNGYMALTKLMNDFGRYEGVWNIGSFDYVGNSSDTKEIEFVKTKRTKNGKEILLRGIYDSLFYVTNLGIGMLKNGTIDYENENTKLNLVYRYNSLPTTDGFVLMVQKETDFSGAEEIWFDFGNYET